MYVWCVAAVDPPHSFTPPRALRFAPPEVKSDDESDDGNSSPEETVGQKRKGRGKQNNPVVSPTG